MNGGPGQDSEPSTPVYNVTPWFIGPPPPKIFTHFTRLLELITLLLISIWVFGFLGGVSGSPKTVNERTNNTSTVFNWHPLLMGLAIPVALAEAILAFRSPLNERSQKKSLHWISNTVAVLLVDLGLLAAVQSHNLKRPSPTPNFYSTHSYMGLLIVILLNTQWVVGFYSYLAPKLSLGQRKALGPIHMFCGRMIFVGALATMAIGIQEKVTFVQFIEHGGLYSSAMKLPATIQLFLFFTGGAVLFHHMGPGQAVKKEGFALELGEPSEGRDESVADP